MDASLKKIDEIELKIRQLVEKLNLLRVENNGLIEKNSQLIIEVENLNKHIEGLKATGSTENVQRMQNNGDLFESQQIREEIDTYIEEIDKCIEILKLN